MIIIIANRGFAWYRLCIATSFAFVYAPFIRVPSFSLLLSL